MPEAKLAEGVKVAVRLRPVPLIAPKLPPVTTTSPALPFQVKVEPGSSLKVKVIVAVSPALSAAVLLPILSVGARVSNVHVCVLPTAALVLLAASVWRT